VPGKAELAHVRGIDLDERAETLLGIGAPVGQPATGLGIGVADAATVYPGGAAGLSRRRRLWWRWRGLLRRRLLAPAPRNEDTHRNHGNQDTHNFPGGDQDTHHLSRNEDTHRNHGNQWYANQDIHNPGYQDTHNLPRRRRTPDESESD
jgi:hypothetical protein